MILNDYLKLSENKRLKKVDSLPDFPHNAVHSDTETVLMTVFEMGTDEPRPYGRPESNFMRLFIKITVKKHTKSFFHNNYKRKNVE